MPGLAAAALEPGRYRLEGAYGDPTLAALGFRLGAYRFDRYREAQEPAPSSTTPRAPMPPRSIASPTPPTSRAT